MVLEKGVPPLKTGVQILCNNLKIRDSGSRRDEGKPRFQTFYETIKLSCQKQGFGMPGPKENFWFEIIF